jgi:hypothetical protein
MLLYVLAVLVSGAEVDPEPSPPTRLLAKMEFSLDGVIQITGKEPQQFALKSTQELYKASVGKRQRTPEEAKKAAAEIEGWVCRRLGVESIDWKKQMLLVVTSGEQERGGHSLQVTGVKVKNGKLTVSWKKQPTNFARAFRMHPGAILLVPRFAGKLASEQEKK